MAPPTFGTAITDPGAGQFEAEQAKLTPKEKCEAKGGFWDEKTQTCILAKPKDKPVEPPRVEATGIETFTGEGGRPVGATVGGKTYFGLNAEDIQLLRQQQEAKKAKLAGTAPVGTAQAQSDIQFRGEQLGGQVGQFGQLPISPTGLDTGEALTAGVVSGIPRTLGILGAAAVGGGFIGAKVGGAAGTAVAPGIGTVIGAAVGLAAGIAASMIGNFKSQRSDTTTAQQRVLDEGKQTLMDWVTLARADPVNKAKYLSRYNMQAALIDQAYRQMKLDTSRDLAKFETALPNLAEFETFYSIGGERDALDLEMRNALIAVPQEGYDILELAHRRKENE